MKHTDKEVAEVVCYSIICEQNTVYRYKQYKYGKLQGVINFTKLDGDHGDANHSGGNYTPLGNNEKSESSTLER